MHSSQSIRFFLSPSDLKIDSSLFLLLQCQFCLLRLRLKVILLLNGPKQRRIRVLFLPATVIRVISLVCLLFDVPNAGLFLLAHEVEINEGILLFSELYPGRRNRHGSDYLFRDYAVFLTLTFSLVALSLAHAGLLLSVFLFLELAQLVKFLRVVSPALGEDLKWTGFGTVRLQAAIPVPFSKVFFL